MANVGNNIRTIRKSKNMTQQDLAEKTGLAKITIQRYEAKKSIPSLDKVTIIASALDCTPMELIIYPGKPDNKIPDGFYPFDYETDELVPNFLYNYTFEKSDSDNHLYLVYCPDIHAHYSIDTDQFAQLVTESKDFIHFLLEKYGTKI